MGQTTKLYTLLCIVHSNRHLKKESTPKLYILLCIVHSNRRLKKESTTKLYTYASHCPFKQMFFLTFWSTHCHHYGDDYHFNSQLHSLTARHLNIIFSLQWWLSWPISIQLSLLIYCVNHWTNHYHYCNIKINKSETKIDRISKTPPPPPKKQAEENEDNQLTWPLNKSLSLLQQ